MMAKASDNYCVVSDLVDTDVHTAYSPKNAQLQLSVNGKIRDSVMTKKQHYTVEELVEYITKYMSIN